MSIKIEGFKKNLNPRKKVDGIRIDHSNRLRIPFFPYFILDGLLVRESEGGSFNV